MIRQISIKTKLGWISAFEEKNRIFRVKFGKHKNKSVSKNLKRFKTNLIYFLDGKVRSIRSNFDIQGNKIQKKVWMELKKI